MQLLDFKSVGVVGAAGLEPATSCV
jgi:hypothetical protein